MTRSIYITCTAFSVLFAAATLCALCVKGTWTGLSSVLGALAVVAVQTAGFFMTRRRSLLSFSFSFLPALAMLAFLLTHSAAWLIASGVLLAVLASLYSIRPSALPKPRFTTQKWVSGLILSEVLLTVLIVIIRK